MKMTSETKQTKGKKIDCKYIKCLEENIADWQTDLDTLETKNVFSIDGITPKYAVAIISGKLALAECIRVARKKIEDVRKNPLD